MSLRPARLAALLAGGLALSAPAEAEDTSRLGLPVTCEIGRDCFVQQLPDMEAGPGVRDPFCGIAAYDGHDGIDIRLLSLRDIARGEPVVAALAGTVKGGRDGMEDRLASTPALREAVQSVECGNGVVLDHGEGLETQYCHLRKGSVRVRPGERVEAGQTLGEIGASGLAEFPHVHLSVRRNGERIDPISGHSVGGGCVAEDTERDTLFTRDAAARLLRPTTQVLAMGLAGEMVDYGSLVQDGPPPAATPRSPITVGWAWLANLRKGDRVRFQLTDPGGAQVLDTTAEPLDNNKAVYSGLAGLRRPPAPGPWTVAVEILREGSPVLHETRQIDLR
ncbi:M23 family metallopeptidase [Aureimonas sp. AU40]|uniref:M23 family metallopeptidase n=1 Tax=Aureimonas sp. AU40 TaxID=1637747 RepID=UPI000786304C|nr:M23 family metallopeptidase [Aureimonas sp. AU40]